MFIVLNLPISLSILSLLSWIANITLVGRPGTPGTPVETGIGKFFKILNAIFKPSIIPPVIPNALVVLSINFKVLFNCLTNLFFLLINVINSAWVGQLACSTYFKNCSDLI